MLLFARRAATLARKQSWTDALEAAEVLVRRHNQATAGEKSAFSVGEATTHNIKQILETKTPLMNLATAYYFNQPGKQIRPLLVLLMSLATSICATPRNPELINRPVSSKCFVKFRNMQEFDGSDESGLRILGSQRRLAEITEMIHTASLLHDDVLDNAMSRRKSPSANVVFDNKVSILAGDFLLGRASIALARLRQPEVFELLATVLADLVEGEIMQLADPPKFTDGDAALNESGTIHESQIRDASKRNFDYYLEKTYMKTASLMAKSCKAAAVLGGTSEIISDAAYDYGKHLGLAFQVFQLFLAELKKLVDDSLDFTSSYSECGKQINVDLELGLATAPVLFAAQEHPVQLWPLIHRKFSQPGDCETARKLVYESSGIEKTKELARNYCDRAVESILALPESVARDALVGLTETVLHRNK